MVPLCLHRATEQNPRACIYTPWHQLRTPLVQSFHCLGVTMETPLHPSYPCTVTPTAVLSSVILGAVRKRCWSMTERNGLSGWLACKKQNKKPLKNSDKCVMPLVIGAHLGKGVRLCVRVADRAQSIPSEGRNQFHLVLLRRCAGAFVHDWPACTF